MENIKLTSKTQKQETWEDDVHNIEATLSYLDELCQKENLSSAKAVLDSVWEGIGKDKKFIDEILLNAQYLVLLPHVQYLMFQEKPSDVDNGLDVIQGCLIEDDQEKAKQVIDAMFNVTPSPKSLLKKLLQDENLKELRIFCEQKAVQYQARNALKGRKLLEDLGEGYARDNRYVYYQNKKLSGANLETFRVLEQDYARDNQYIYFRGNKIWGVDNSSFKILGGGYSTDDKWLFFEHRKTTTPFDTQKQTFELSDQEGEIILNGEKTLRKGKEVPIELGDGYEIKDDLVFFNGKEVLGASFQEFKPLGNGYATDNKWLYFEGNRTNISFKYPKQTFAPLSEEEGSGLLDNTIIIKNGKEAPTAIGGGYFKTKEDIYFEEELVNDAQVKTFEVIQDKCGMDQNAIFYTHEKLRDCLERGEKIEIDTIAKKLILQGKLDEIFRAEFKKQIGQEVLAYLLERGEQDFLYQNIDKILSWFEIEDVNKVLKEFFHSRNLKEKTILLIRIPTYQLSEEEFIEMVNDGMNPYDLLSKVSVITPEMFVYFDKERSSGKQADLMRNIDKWKDINVRELGDFVSRFNWDVLEQCLSAKEIKKVLKNLSKFPEILERKELFSQESALSRIFQYRWDDVFEVFPYESTEEEIDFVKQLLKKYKAVGDNSFSQGKRFQEICDTRGGMEIKKTEEVKIDEKGFIKLVKDGENPYDLLSKVSVITPQMIQYFPYRNGKDSQSQNEKLVLSIDKMRGINGELLFDILKNTTFNTMNGGKNNALRKLFKHFVYIEGVEKEIFKDKDRLQNIFHLFDSKGIKLEGFQTELEEVEYEFLKKIFKRHLANMGPYALHSEREAITRFCEAGKFFSSKEIK